MSSCRTEYKMGHGVLVGSLHGVDVDIPSSFPVSMQ